MKPGRFILIQVIIIAAVVLIGGLVYYYWHQGYQYVSTQDAAISAPSINAVSPSSGTISHVGITTGQRVTKGQTIMTESTPTTSAKGVTTTKTVNITAPITGVVANVTAHSGQSVGAGTPLYTLVRMNKIDVVANVPETRIRHVSPGQTVNIYVAAHPGVTFSGTVRAIQPTTQSFFSLIPTSATAGTFTKVIQRVPVTISIQSAGYSLLPGESASVRITVH